MRRSTATSGQNSSVAFFFQIGIISVSSGVRDVDSGINIKNIGKLLDLMNGLSANARKILIVDAETQNPGFGATS